MRRPQRGRTRATAGFTLLPVVLAMSLIGAIAFMLNRDNGLNANFIGSQSDLARARYAAEAGLQAVNYTIQALGCAGSYPISSSPVTDGNFGAAAYSAYANNSGGSPLTLTSTGSYNGASVTLTKTNAYVYQPYLPGITPPWVTQPDPATAKDTYLSKANPPRNYGGDTQLRLRSPKDNEPLLQFDLSPLPAGSRIIAWYDSSAGRLQPGAQVSLYKTNVNASVIDSIDVLLITRSWVAGTLSGSAPADGATWNTYDGVNAWPAPGVGYDARPLSSAAYQWLAGWQDVDVTDAVLGWISGVYPNYGIWLSDAGTLLTKDARYVASDDAVNVTQRPKLTAYYLLPCGATAPP